MAAKYAVLGARVAEEDLINSFSFVAAKRKSSACLEFQGCAGESDEIWTDLSCRKSGVTQLDSGQSALASEIPRMKEKPRQSIPP